MDELPPIGGIQENDHPDVCGYVQWLALECYDDRQPWLLLADRNVLVYERGDDIEDPDDLSNLRVSANDIQNDVIAITDVQSKEPPTCSLEPSDTGDVPQVFWVGPAQTAQQLGIDPVFVWGATDPASGRQLAPPPLPEGMVQQMDAGGMLHEDWVVRVNAELTGEFYQTLFDKVWQRSRLDQWFRSNVLQTNIAGWQFALYEFDQEAKTVCMTELSCHQTFTDTIVATLEKAAYAGVDILVDKGWAMRRYPWIAEVIEAEARTGQPLRPDSTDSLAEMQGINFRRRMVTMRIWWFRNQPMLLTAEDAIAGGHVVPTQVISDQLSVIGEDGEAAMRAAEQQQESQPIADGQLPISDSMGNRQSAIGNSPLPGTNGENNPLNQSGNDGFPIAAGQLPISDSMGNGQPAIGNPPPPTRTALLHPETGEELTTSHPQWPTRRVLRRLVIINNVVAEDREEPSWDIPLVHNVAIPIPRKPWGIGEPYRLLNMQRARNRMLGAIVDHCDYNAHPPTVMSQTMHQATVAAYKDARVRPGATVIVPDDVLAAAGGKIDLIQALPPLAPHLVEAQAMLKQEIADSSGNTDVLQGRVPASQAKSGRAIELLQAAGSSSIGLKAQFGGDMVYRLARLILHDLARFMTVDDCLKITRKYPPHVVAALLQLGRDLEWEISVSIAGGGPLAQTRRQKAMEDLKAGAISMETYRDKNGIDHKQEVQRGAGEGMKQVIGDR